MDVFLNGFPKKLLVAVSVVAIVSMCLMPAEGLVAHRRRHQRQATRPPPKLSRDAVSQPRRPKQVNADLYKKVTDRVMRKLRNVKTYFSLDESKLGESKLFENGKPKWLPKVNFLNIRQHNYTSPHRGALIKELRFNYLMPKVYKSLKEYERLFQILLKVSIEFDDDFSSDIKNRKWKEALRNTQGNLTSLITVVTDSMYMVRLPLPKHDKDPALLIDIGKKVNYSQSLKNNYLAFRGYESLLKNWFAEFKCSQYRREKGSFLSKPTKTMRICREYVARLNRRRNAHSSSQRKRRSKDSS